MAYLVLARKWRPRKFTDVIGQEHVTLTLRKAVEKGRLAHAYLFSGPRGCGKTSTARLLAKVINCENRQGSEPCDKCSSCTSVNDGRHLDMIEIDGASNRGIDEIRDLREKIGYAPSQSLSKIYIIDEVHMLTPQAFNALLKTLEEPPSHVYLIFATTEPHKVPATILSRCQRFNFKRLEIPELTGQLERICNDEKIEFDREALLLISRRADGSMRDAESLLDQCIAALDDRIDLEIVRRVLGLVDSKIIAELLSTISRRDRKGALGIIDQVVSSGLDLEEFFLAYLEGIRNLIVLSVDKDSPEWLDLTSDELLELRGIAGVFRTEDLLFLFRLAAQAFRELKNSSQPRYHLEAAVTEAASWESSVEISELIRRIDEGGTGNAGSTRRGGGAARAVADGSTEISGAGTGIASPSGGKTGGNASIAPKGDLGATGINETFRLSSVKPAPEDQPSSKKASAAIDHSMQTGISHDDPALSQLGGKNQWERFLAQVRESKLTLGIWLMSARVEAVDGDRLLLAFSSQNRFACEMVREAKNKRYIETHLERFYGRKFVVEAGESADVIPVISEAEEKTEKKAPITGPDDKLLQKLLDDTPMVRKIMEEFDGEIYKE